jgi:hypothetical protein
VVDLGLDPGERAEVEIGDGVGCHLVFLVPSRRVP